MIRIYPAAKRTRNGFRPMLILQNSNGRRYGSRISHAMEFAEKDAARTVANVIARRVATQFADIVMVG